MKRNMWMSVLVAFTLVGLVSTALAQSGTPPVRQSQQGVPLGTAFTYQGQLKGSTGPVTGSCDMAFRLYDDPSAGNLVGSPITPTVTITNGLFTVPLDFGNAFTGAARWLNIAVRCPAGSGSFTALTPRQEVTPAPYAFSLLPGAVISGSLYNELTVLASSDRFGNPVAVHGIGGATANLLPAVPVGIWGESHAGIGVLGASDTSDGVGGYSHTLNSSGVYGSNDGGGAAVHGSATTGNGVYGETSGTTAGAAAVYGKSIAGGYGVTGASSNIGVYADNTANGNVAYLGAPCCAGDFYGGVNVSGSFNVSNGTKNFVIDDPLDPANKYLYHAAVEAPEMTNFYSGIVMLDEKGEAVVQLPDWFEAINQDFRYQLTAMGAPGPNLYIAEEVTQNHFKIAGGKPGAKVSWQVTATRHDAWAVQHPFQVETEKPAAERGTYLYPRGFGQPDTLSLESVRRQQLSSQAVISTTAPLPAPSRPLMLP